MNVKQFQAGLQSGLDYYYNNVAQLVSSSTAKNVPIPPHKIDSIQKSTQSIMSYIAGQLLDAGGEVVLDDCMGKLCIVYLLLTYGTCIHEACSSVPAYLIIQNPLTPLLGRK
jgi:hypothetical protein